MKTKKEKSGIREWLSLGYILKCPHLLCLYPVLLFGKKGGRRKIWIPCFTRKFLFNYTFCWGVKRFALKINMAKYISWENWMDIIMNEFFSTSVQAGWMYIIISAPYIFISLVLSIFEQCAIFFSLWFTKKLVAFDFSII